MSSRKSNHIQEIFTKYKRVVASRAPMMHCLEIMLKTPYGRQYMRALGIDIDNTAYVHIHNIFEIPAGIMEATHADIEHDLLTLEILMKELHFPKIGKIEAIY